ncbi:hypothetical protein CSUI_003243 [Cystoisospora suis]|uniref:Uncharacterized protein n=1 Tax=Cystoisospora suis TaxID=483139 RepID=A0A2C6KFU3_9APIC|nr:hypothetical protein CSUI_003243 [Cystoisospora suis]
MHPADVQREDQVVINSAGGAVTLHRAEDSQLYVNGDIQGASVWAKLLRASNILDHYWGPVTVFAFPDSALLDPDNRPIPDCVWNGFLREENKDYLLRFLGNMIVPGVFDTASLKEGNTLLPLVGVPWEVGKPGPPDSEHDSASISIGDTSILVPDIRTEEGVLHLFAAFKPHIEKDFSNAVYWTCLDDFLRENPSFISLAFRLLDSGRPLPKLGAPPGPRPEWVARWSEKWRPYKPSVARPPARRAPA